MPVRRATITATGIRISSIRVWIPMTALVERRRQVEVVVHVERQVAVLDRLSGVHSVGLLGTGPGLVGDARI
jgi:hypothetical protein